MKIKSAVQIVIIILLCIASAYIFYLRNKLTVNINYLNFYLGKVEVIRNDSAALPASIKMPLYLSDIIKTYVKSRVWIQCGADNLIEVDELSELSMRSLPDRIESAAEKTELQLISGKIKAFSAKLTDKGEFHVRAGAKTVAVRGTLFSVELHGSDLTVLVCEGEVSVFSDESSGVSTVKAGQRAFFADDNVKIETMNEADKGTFASMLKLEPFPGIPCTPAQYIDTYYRKILNIDNDSGSDSTYRNNKIPDKPEQEEDILPPEGGVRLGVVTFKGAGVDQSEVLDVTQQFYNGLTAVKGKNLVVRHGTLGRSVNRQLTGRISALGATRILAVNVLNVQTGKIIITRTITIRPDDDIPALIGALVKYISESDAVWKL